MFMLVGGLAVILFFPLLKGVLQEVSLSQGASGQSFLRKVAIPPSSEMESCHQVAGLWIMGTLFC